jgi:Ni,Fe-hydrogenase III large subunit
MPARSWFDRSEAVPGAPGVRMTGVTREQWRAAAQDLAAADARFVSLWVDCESREVAVWAAFLADRGVLLLRLETADRLEPYPRIDDLFAGAARLQRAAADLSGLRPSGGDTRPWLRHAAWQTARPPLGPQMVGVSAGCQDEKAAGAVPIDDYPFVRVEGEGVHEIAVGPIHAGIIEPGHFRFSVVGEKVLRLEERLGYVHKGIERRFNDLKLLEGHRLAARVSGDSAVAYSWAYCQAFEGMISLEPPARGHWLRALALEIERISNHLGDLGALGNDAGFAFGLAQFMRLKEQVLRLCREVLGQRYLFDFIVPGGTAADLDDRGRGQMREALRSINAEVTELRTIYDEHAGVRDRFVGAGMVVPSLARQLGLAGMAGRASGQAFDLRVDLPCKPYDQLDVRKAGSAAGDVAARVAVRFAELGESIRLASAVLDRIPSGPYLALSAGSTPAALGLGLVEGWRGPVLVALRSAPDGGIARCHVHDPSSLNWHALEHAVIGNIVPDFPLINKSFNLSYSGHDL